MEVIHNSVVSDVITGQAWYGGLLVLALLITAACAAGKFG